MPPLEFKRALNILQNEIKVCSAIIFGKPKDETFFNEYLEILKETVDKPMIFNLNLASGSRFIIDFICSLIIYNLVEDCWFV